MVRKKTVPDVRYKKLKSLTDWDWTVLPAAWRYYEYRQTIASSMFPGDIVRRFFSGEYDENSCNQIARQFAEVDHHRGESDWMKDGIFNHGLSKCDKEAWCMFWAFCNAWIHGFTTLTVDNGKRFKEDIAAFWCEYTKKWHPKDMYISNPYVYCHIPDEWIVDKCKNN